MHCIEVDHLAPSSLLAETDAYASQERVTTAGLVARLARIDGERHYAQLGYSSMKAYCMGRLRMTEGHAARRIHAARAVREFPALLAALADERLDLTAVNLIAPHLSDDNVDELVAAATHQSRARIEVMLAERFPRPDAPDGIVGGHEHTLAYVRDVSKLNPLSAGRVLMQCTMSTSTQQKLRTALELMSHRNPSGAFDAALDEALDLLIEQLEKEKFATGGTRGDARHVPSAVKKAVWHRDGGACAFVGSDGHRCGCRWMVEFDHVEPVANGGEATVDNVRLLCRTHNQLEAERRFGAGFMEMKRREASARRAAHRGRLTGTYAGVCSSRSVAGQRMPEGSMRDGDVPYFMFATRFSPNSEHLISVAPSIRRAKS